MKSMKFVMILALSSVFSVSAFANRTFVEVDLKRMEGSKEATTKAMMIAVENAVISQCEAVSSFDEVKLASEEVTNRMIKNIEVSEAPTCDVNLPGCRSATRVIGSDIFRSSELVLVRESSESGEGYSIVVSTDWDLDLPAPQPVVQIEQSVQCKVRD